MKNLFRYEIKKHIKVVLAILLIIFIILLLETTFYSKVDYLAKSDVYEYAKSLLGTFIFLFIRLFLFGLFVYFGTDFIKNLMTDEKNFLFAIPVKSSEFFLAKILSITVMVATIFIEIIFGGYLLDLINGHITNRIGSYELFAENVKGFTSLYTLCLVALLLAYFTILVSKKHLEKTRFQFLWLLPFSILFSIYYSVILILFHKGELFLITPVGWILVLINLILVGVLFHFNCKILDTRTDL